jgi:hypothetical protein
MWKNIYFFNSHDLEKSGVFFPTLDNVHKDWVIPPTLIESA